MPRKGEITATVDVVPGRWRYKVRAIVWSGQDFRTPTVHCGALFADRATADEVADKYRDALRLVGIPIEGDTPAGDHFAPLLPAVSEGEAYPGAD